MSTSLTKLPARDPDSDHVNVVVDTPKGSRNKYKYDEKSQIWRLSKMLPLGSVFPFDFGFIPSTEGDDGDPLDVLVLTEEPSFAGCVLPAILIGVLEAEQTEEGNTVRNDRLIGVVETPFRERPAEFVGRLKAYWSGSEKWPERQRKAKRRATGRTRRFTDPRDRTFF